MRYGCLILCRTSFYLAKLRHAMVSISSWKTFGEMSNHAVSIAVHISLMIVDAGFCMQIDLPTRSCKFSIRHMLSKTDGHIYLKFSECSSNQFWSQRHELASWNCLLFLWNIKTMNGCIKQWCNVEVTGQQDVLREDPI